MNDYDLETQSLVETDQVVGAGGALQSRTEAHSTAIDVADKIWRSESFAHRGKGRVLKRSGRAKAKMATPESDYNPGPDK